MKGFIFGVFFTIVTICIAYGYLYVKSPEYKCKHNKEFTACLEWGEQVLKETFNEKFKDN